MPQKQIVATEILVFDFELFIGDRYDLLAVTISWAILVAWPWLTSDDRLQVDYDR